MYFEELNIIDSNAKSIKHLFLEVIQAVSGAKCGNIGSQTAQSWKKLEADALNK